MYLDRTFAQRIGSAKVKSKSEVTHCTARISCGRCSAPTRKLCVKTTRIIWHKI